MASNHPGSFKSFQYRTARTRGDISDPSPGTDDIIEDQSVIVSDHFRFRKSISEIVDQYFCINGCHYPGSPCMMNDDDVEEIAREDLNFLEADGNYASTWDRPRELHSFDLAFRWKETERSLENFAKSIEALAQSLQRLNEKLSKLADGMEQTCKEVEALRRMRVAMEPQSLGLQISHPLAAANQQDQ